MKTLRWMFTIGLLTMALALTACGDDGGDGNTDVDAPAANEEPVASFTMTPDCTADANAEITFTSTSTDADGDELSCSWVFGSGTPGTSTLCEATGVTFPSVAPYEVVLSVDDGNGGVASTNMTIAPCN